MKQSETYCVKCKAAVKPKKLDVRRDRRGRARVQGRCPHCDTMTYKYIAEKK